jgi:hypothetical protein
VGFLVYTWIKVNAGIYAIFNCFGGFCLPASRGGTLREKQNYFQITIRAPPWMKEGRDNTWRVGGLPTLPGLNLSTFQPSQRGFFRVQSTYECVKGGRA